MAHIRRDPKSGVFFIRFRYGGRSINRSLKTISQSEAEVISGRIRETILLIERGRIEMPPDADPAEFILSDGKRLGKAEKPKVCTLADLFQTYNDEMPAGAKEDLKSPNIQVLPLRLRCHHSDDRNHYRQVVSVPILKRSSLIASTA